MPRINYYLKKALSMPPHIVMQKAMQKITTKLIGKIKRARDLNANTHIHFNVPLIQNRYIDLKDLDTSNIDQKTAIYLSDMYCEHRFDLLGSGWVKNSYDSQALGVEGYQYAMNVPAPVSVNIGYELIDWQKDTKSGYRWSEKTWYKDITYGKPGVDIKVPWELARLQHLPQLALFAITDTSLKEQNIKEFKYQVLDFIANNPPRKGVNWACTMDVGIRAANMLIAYDMFTQMDDFRVIDEPFKQIFANSIYEHGMHIINNLEYSEWLTSNHYLCNIAGLLYISAYLDSTEQIDQWLQFSIQEIINEMKNQFYEDGGNFESSTNYHRLSGEVMVFSSALILGLKKGKLQTLKDCSSAGWKVKPKLMAAEQQEFTIDLDRAFITLPQWYIDQLYKIGRFTVDITKPNGEVPQFGDNDSGRFFRLSPNGEFLTNKEAVIKYLNLKGHIEDSQLFWDENILNHSTLISAFAGVFDDAIFVTDTSFEKSLITSLATQKLHIKNSAYSNPIITKSIQNLKYTDSFKFKSEGEIECIQSFNYPQSGIYIFKNNLFYLAICATPLGQKNNGGHTHNDKLGFELYLNGKNIVRDPGTYLYTPIPTKRNEFRSTEAHNVPLVSKIEQNYWIDSLSGLFTMHPDSKCAVSLLDDMRIELCLQYHDIIIQRKFEIQKNRVIISDRCNKKFKYNEFKMYSNGYGKLICQ